MRRGIRQVECGIQSLADGVDLLEADHSLCLSPYVKHTCVFLHSLRLNTHWLRLTIRFAYLSPYVKTHTDKCEKQKGQNM
jgi:hypothetical protein